MTFAITQVDAHGSFQSFAWELEKWRSSWSDAELLGDFVNVPIGMMVIEDQSDRGRDGEEVSHAAVAIQERMEGKSRTQNGMRKSGSESEALASALKQSWSSRMASSVRCGGERFETDAFGSVRENSRNLVGCPWC